MSSPTSSATILSSAACARRTWSKQANECVASALAGILSPEQIYGTELDFAPRLGEVRAIKPAPAGYGKVAVIEELGKRLGVAADRVICVGDGSSDVHVMLHVNNHDSFTIAVSDNRQLACIARSSILSDAFSVMVPALDRILD